MSYQTRPNNARPNNTRPNMHCKVCESAKKSPSIIASHFPKNRDGITVCPTLLAQQCRGCGKNGHTISYCSTTNAPQKEAPKAMPKKEPNTTKPTPKTAYDSLYISDDDEKEEKPKELKPTKLKPTKEKKGPPVKFCWATAESDSSGSEEETEEETD